MTFIQLHQLAGTEPFVHKRRSSQFGRHGDLFRAFQKLAAEPSDGQLEGCQRLRPRQRADRAKHRNPLAPRSIRACLRVGYVMNLRIIAAGFEASRIIDRLVNKQLSQIADSHALFGTVRTEAEGRRMRNSYEEQLHTRRSGNHNRTRSGDTSGHVDSTEIHARHGDVKARREADIEIERLKLDESVKAKETMSPNRTDL